MIAAAVEDMQDCQISNRIILAGLLLGIFEKIRQNGYIGIVEFLFGISVPILFLWWLFRFKMLGAGDIKLLSVIGGIFGVPFVIRVMVAAFFLGAVMSVFQLLRHKSLGYRLHYLAEYVSYYFKTKEIKPYYVKERDGTKPVVHFAAAVLGGFVLSVI